MGPFKIWTFLSGFQMFFDKMAAMCPDFKFFRISEPIRNPDHFQPNLFWTIQKSRLGRIFDPWYSWYLEISRIWEFGW